MGPHELKARFRLGDTAKDLFIRGKSPHRVCRSPPLRAIRHADARPIQEGQHRAGPGAEKFDQRGFQFHVRDVVDSPGR